MGNTAEWFNELYRRYKVSLLKTAVIELGNYAVAEEVVQEVFWQLLLKRKRGEVIRYPGKWMFITLDNLIKNETRRAKYRYEVPLDFYYDLSTAGPEEKLKLEYVLPAELSESEREILILYYEEDWTHQEIGKYYGCGEHASHMRLHRAKEHYRELKLEERKLQEKRENSKK